MSKDESKTASRAIFTRFHYFHKLFNKKNVLLKKSICFRKFNSRRQTYFIVLKEILTDKKQAYYELFVTSLKKKKRFHRDKFLSKLKYYH